uniref:Secreted protein n=1 Tax=Phasianus colchicus TaxID=9054 RepID=A0A669PN38_PHACC
MAMPWPFVLCLSAQQGASAASRAWFCAVSSCLEQLRSSLCSLFHAGCHQAAPSGFTYHLCSLFPGGISVPLAFCCLNTRRTACRRNTSKHTWGCTAGQAGLEATGV